MSRAARDLKRIPDVLTAAGVTQIDHMWLTHYHGDHYGNMVDVSKRISITQLYDHGLSIEGDRPWVAAFQKVYAERYPKIPRSVVKPGDKIAFTGTDMTVVMSDGNPLTKPLAKVPGAGRPNPLCAAFTARDESTVDPDNHQSAGFVMAYGTSPARRTRSACRAYPPISSSRGFTIEL